MIKVYLAIGFLAVYAAAVSYGTWQIVSGKQAKQEVKIITTQVEDHNDDLISLAEHSAEIEQMARQYEAALRAIPRVHATSDCPVSELKRVYNEAIASVNSMRIPDGGT